MKIRKKEGTVEKDGRLLRASQDYVVYGISFQGSPEFLVYEPDELSFPFFVASEAVDVLDGRLSIYWSYSPQLPATDNFSSRAPLVSFEAFVRNRQFYQALVDGEPAAATAWKAAKQKIDAEVAKHLGVSES